MMRRTAPPHPAGGWSKSAVCSGQCSCSTHLLVMLVQSSSSVQTLLLASPGANKVGPCAHDAQQLGLLQLLVQTLLPATPMVLPLRTLQPAGRCETPL